MCSNRIVYLHRVLDQGSIRRLKNAADSAQALENRWMQKLLRHYAELDRQVWEHIETYGRPPDEIDFLSFYVEHSFESLAIGFKTAYTREQELEVPYQVVRKLAAAPPKGNIPKNLRDLMALWDQWRKRKKIPARQKVLADKIAKSYLKRVQSVWEKYGEAFRTGDEMTRDSVRKYIQKASYASYGRAKMIVQTETTYYYNKARRDVYDQSEDVTHYLFVAVRDSATTKWCNTRQGLVYEKGTDFLSKETPPIHWNCRSELLPLTPANPKHLALINDKSRDRSRKNPAPLPKGWNKRTA